MLSDDIFSLVMAPLLRAFLVMLGKTTGVWIRFEKVRGDFFSYRVCLDGVDLKISNHLRCFADSCTLEFSILDISLDTLIVSNVIIEGARFEYEHLGGEQDVIPRKLPPFLIRHLALKNADLVFTDHSRDQPYTFNIHLDDYRCDALHSHWLLFDAIFTSTLIGRLEASPLSIQYSETGDKCLSQWALKGMPIRQVSHFADGKLDLLEQGAFDLLVHNEWQMDKDEILMNVQVSLVDLVNFKLPPQLPSTTKTLAAAMNVLLNQQVKSLPVAFQFKAKKGDFMDLTKLDATGILTAFADALTQAIMDKSLQNYDQLWDMGLQGLNTLLNIKKFFDK